MRLQKFSPELSSYEDRTLYSTWQISLNHVKQQNELSAKLLCFWAYFNNQDLWLELLQHNVSNYPDWLQQVAKDEVTFHDVMRILSNHGLVEVDMSAQDLIESRGYSIHGCVHAWTVSVLNQTWDRDLARLAVRLVGSHVPGEKTVQPWLTQRRLLQHATKCSYMVLSGLAPEDAGMAWAVYKLGKLYQNQGKLVEAEQMYQRALQGFEKAWGLEHMLTLTIVNNLGCLYKDQGKLVEAEQMFQRALQGKEKVWGLEHTSTLTTVNNLGCLYADQGKLVEAEQIYQRALQGYEKALSADGTSTSLPALNTFWGLGFLFELQGDLAQAKIMYSRALEGYKKVVGPDHPKSRSLRDNLQALDTTIDEENTEDKEGLVNNPRGERSH